MTGTIQRQQYQGGRRRFDSDKVPVLPSLQQLIAAVPEYVELLASARNETELLDRYTPRELFNIHYKHLLADLVGTTAQRGPMAFRTREGYNVAAGYILRSLEEALADRRKGII